MGWLCVLGSLGEGDRVSHPLTGCDSLRLAADHIWETCFSCWQPGDGAHGEPSGLQDSPCPCLLLLGLWPLDLLQQPLAYRLGA